METKIRKAGRGDVEILVELGRKTFYEAFRDKNTEENMKLFLESNFRTSILEEEMKEAGAVFFLAYWGEKPVGFTKMRIGHEPEELKAGRPLEVERIYVDGEYLDKKIGSALMTHNIEYGRKEGFDTIWLGVWEHNSGAIRFYERWGFAAFGSHIFVVGNDPQTDLLMQKKL